MTTPAIKHIRLPRGLLDDLQTADILQCRAWIAYVARETGKSPHEAIQRVMGMGALQPVLVAAEPQDPCPWHDRLGDGLWRPCRRQRLTPTMPCQIHERPASSSSLYPPEVDMVFPYLYKGRIYWTVDEPDADVFREDGMLETGFRIRFYNDEDGERRPIIVRHLV